MAYISIVTAAYNAEKSINKLIDSLAEQKFRDYEWVIQDGLSIDNTLNIIKKKSLYIPSISLKSEYDTGIYDAWNKALQRISGEWVIFLGADDYFANSLTLEHVFKILKKIPKNYLFAAGELYILDKNNSIIYHAHEFKKINMHEGRIPAAFPSLFIRYSLLSRKCFDAQFKIAGDLNFLANTWEDSIAVHIPFVVTHMITGGISSKQDTLRRKERDKIIYKKYPIKYFLFNIRIFIKKILKLRYF